MNPDNVLEELGRAHRALRAAQILHASDLLEDAVSRSYDAVMHAAKAALLVHDVIAESPAAVRRLFGSVLVRPDLIAREWASVLARVQDQRIAADYSIGMGGMRRLRCILAKTPKRFSNAYAASSEASGLLWKSDYHVTPDGHPCPLNHTVVSTHSGLRCHRLLQQRECLSCLSHYLECTTLYSRSIAPVRRTRTLSMGDTMQPPPLLPMSLQQFVHQQATFPSERLVDPAETRQYPYGTYWWRAIAGILLAGRVKPRHDRAPNMTDVNRLCKEANFNQYLFERVTKFLVNAQIIDVSKGQFSCGTPTSAFLHLAVPRATGRLPHPAPVLPGAG